MMFIMHIITVTDDTILGWAVTMHPCTCRFNEWSHCDCSDS